MPADSLLGDLNCDPSSTTTSLGSESGDKHSLQLLDKENEKEKKRESKKKKKKRYLLDE